MHRFNPIAGQVLLGLESVAGSADANPTALIVHCHEIFHAIPEHAEFAEAFNQLLYISAITIDGEKVSLANFGRDLINSSRRNAGTNAQPAEILERINKELSGYKLKSMCNRNVWSQTQYQQTVEHCREDHKQ